MMLLMLVVWVLQCVPHCEVLANHADDDFCLGAAMSASF